MVFKGQVLNESTQISVPIREGISTLVDDKSFVLFGTHSSADERHLFENYGIAASLF